MYHMRTTLSIGDNGCALVRIVLSKLPLTASFGMEAGAGGRAKAGVTAPALLRVRVVGHKSLEERLAWSESL